MKYSPYESMTHGLTMSKIWLCEQLEPHIKQMDIKPKICILGAWTNILSYMLLVRNASLYQEIFAYDIDTDAVEIANQICDAWRFEEPHVNNIQMDANDVSYDAQVVINCSVEHMSNNQWFDNIPNGTLVCLQSSNVTINHEPWMIVNPNSSLEEFRNKYPLSDTLYTGTKPIRYNHWGYDRYMIIGIK